MMGRRFPYRIVVEWSPEDEAYVARVPAFGPACAGDGPSPEAATRNAVSAATAMLEVLEEDGDPAPAPDVAAGYSGQFRVRLPRALHATLARLAAADGVSLNQEVLALLARRLGAAASSEVARRVGSKADARRRAGRP